MNKLYVDFETYCDLDIKKVSGWNYINHPSLEILCMGWAVDDKKANLWVPGMTPPRVILHAFKQGVPIYAHNAMFEFRVFEKFRELLGIEDRVRLKQFIDTQALAGMFGLPLKLEKFCEAVNAPISKDKRGTHLIQKLCKPRKKTKTNSDKRWTPVTAPQDFKDFYEYCRTDVESMRSAVKQLPLERLPKFEQLVWRHTQARNNRGVHIDMGAVMDIIYAIDRFKHKCNAELALLTNGVITKGTQRERIFKWLNENGCEVPDIKADTLRDRLSVTGDAPACRRVIELRQMTAHTSIAKFNRMVQFIGDDGRIHDNEVYHGAHTGRFAGRGVQVHNLPRKKHENPDFVLELFATRDMDLITDNFPNVSEAASKLVRPTLVAGPGKDLLVGDYSSIENRVLHWLAGDIKTVSEFAQGLDQYKTFAADRFKIKYSEVSKQQRDRSKPSVLGLGFAGAHAALMRIADGYGIELTEKEAKDEVKFYRKKYKEVRKMWYRIYDCCIRAIKAGKSMYHSRWVKIRMFRKGDWLFIKLPSGRLLSYPEVKTKEGMYGPVFTYMGVKNKQWLRIWTHAGSMTENIVQAIARDLLVYGSLCAEQGNYPGLMTVHDEYVAEVDEGEGNINEFFALLCLKQKWATVLPLAADGYRGKRYKKD